MLVKLLRRLRRSQSGSTLVSVLVIMLVLTMFAVTVATVVTSTTRSLAATRATTQARQAADAGLAAALAAFKRTTNCAHANLSTDSAPAYDVTCTVVGNVVTFKSVGHGDDSADARVKATYEFEIVEVDDDVDHMTFFSGATFTLETDSTDPSGGLLRITIANGNFTCQNKIDANLVVAGNFYGNGSCVIAGDVWAGGLITSSNNDRIKGNATSAATSGNNIWLGSIDGDYISGTDVELAWDSSRRIGGNLRSKGNVTLRDAKVGGNLIAPVGKMVTASWQTSVNLPAGGHAQVGGSIVRPASVSAPDAPAYLPWRDYNFSPADWGGYALWTLTPADCTSFNSSPNTGWKNLKNLTTPTILDARGCSGGLTSNNGGNPAPAIQTNIVLVSSTFNLTTLKVTKSATAAGDPKMWIIVPDTEDNDQPLASPSCSGTGSIDLNHTNISVPTFLYTPGCIKVSGGGTFKGTMYSGAFNYGGQIDMEGVKVGFPGGGVAGGADGAGAGGLIMTKLVQRECSKEGCEE